MTAIDTVYEYAGYSLAGRIHSVLWSVGLPLIIALAGVAYTVHTVTEKGSIKDLLLYVFYLLFAGWLTSSTSLQGVSTPRFLAWLGRAADVVEKRAVSAVQKDFLTAPFEWERIAAMVSFGRINDPALELRIDRFLEGCARLALATSPGPVEGNLFRAGRLAYSPECERARAEIWAGLERHAKESPFHREAISLAAAREPAKAAEFRERYLDRLCARAIEAPGSPVSESRLVAASLGDFAYAVPAESTGWGSRFLQTLFGASPLHSTNPEAILGLSEITQAIDLEVTSRQKYFLATVLAPHVFGLSLMILLGLFPLAALFSLLPGKWRALVNYGKLLVSVKLWPLGWAALSVFNAKRSLHEVFEPAERGSGNVAFAVAAFYFLVPAVSFLVVHLAATAAAMPFAQASPPPSGPPISPAAAVTVALRQARS